MRHTIRFSWTTYKNHPFASFVSRSQNVTGFIMAIGVLILLGGFSSGDPGTIIAAVMLFVIPILYLIWSNKYLSKLEDRLRAEESKRKEEKELQELEELKIAYPSFNYNQEFISNIIFRELRCRGYSIKEAYEMSHGLRKLEKRDLFIH